VWLKVCFGICEMNVSGFGPAPLWPFPHTTIHGSIPTIHALISHCHCCGIRTCAAHKTTRNLSCYCLLFPHFFCRVSKKFSKCPLDSGQPTVGWQTNEWEQEKELGTWNVERGTWYEEQGNNTLTQCVFWKEAYTIYFQIKLSKLLSPQ